MRTISHPALTMAGACLLDQQGALTDSSSTFLSPAPFTAAAERTTRATESWNSYTARQLFLLLLLRLLLVLSWQWRCEWLCVCVCAAGAAIVVCLCLPLLPGLTGVAVGVVSVAEWNGGRSLLLVHELEVVEQREEAAARAGLPLPLLEQRSVVMAGVSEEPVQSTADGREDSGRLIAHRRTTGKQLRVAQQHSKGSQSVAHIGHRTALRTNTRTAQGSTEHASVHSLADGVWPVQCAVLCCAVPQCCGEWA